MSGARSLRWPRTSFASGTFSASLWLPADALPASWSFLLSAVLCCCQAPKGEARGEINYRRSLGSSLAQLHRGSGQCAALCSDDDGQGDATISSAPRRFLISMTPDVVSGRGGGHPAGSRRAAGQHENSGSEYQPQTSQLRQQPNPQEKETAGVRRHFAAMHRQ